MIYPCWYGTLAKVILPFLRGVSYRGAFDSERIKNKCTNVLVVRLDETGDVVITSAFLRELRANLENCNITLVVRPDSFNLVELCPYVNDIYVFNERLVYDTRTLTFCEQAKRQFCAINFARKYLWNREPYDIAFVPRWDADYYNASFLALYSGARSRIGYSSSVDAIKDKLNFGFDALYTHVSFEKTPKHEADRNLDLLSFLGMETKNSKLEVWIGDDDYKFANDLLLKHQFSLADSQMKQGPIIAFGLGGREAKKQWPANSFVQLGSHLARNFGATIVLLGGRLEQSLIIPPSEVVDRFIDVTGVVTWRQTAAILSKCDLYVGNNTATLHIASAVNIPIIEISCHPSDGDEAFYLSPKRFGASTMATSVAIRPKSGISPCKWGCMAKTPHCITQISVDEVIQAVCDVIEI